MTSLAVSHRTPLRVTQGVLSVALLGASITVVATTDAAWWWVAATVMAPDAALLLGFGRGLARGQLHPRAVPLYNALHHPAGPIALGALAALGIAGTGPAAAALAWGFHIAMDRAAGYGPRTRDGFPRS